MFLDRDGVINVHRPNDYVKSVEEFEFIDGAKEALKILAPHFRHIFIVTNQRGVGKGLMTEQQLAEIHNFMCSEIAKSGGRIDRIYVSTATNEDAPDRKPNPGMARQAKSEFPDIDFSKSFMAGDSETDMQFAENAGIKPVLLGNRCDSQKISGIKIFANFPDLINFALALADNKL
ncbi:MAG: HAD family hydrolase [Dysgonamonadaceae bacterium]|nr:HAD family hydrolase [Dysgonamonadaceae bacterium]